MSVIQKWWFQINIPTTTVIVVSVDFKMEKELQKIGSQK